MFYKLKTIYQSHFKLVSCINLFITGYFSLLFYMKGFDKYPLYMLALMFKGMGYGITLLIERLFFLSRGYYYRNMGLGYRKVFSIFFGLDFVMFIVVLLLISFWKSFI